MGGAHVVVAREQRARVTKLEDGHRHKRSAECGPGPEHRAPPLPRREDDQQEREERRESAPRRIRISDQREQAAEGDALPAWPGSRIAHAGEREQEEGEEKRLESHLEHESCHLEEPWSRRGERRGSDSDRPTSRQPKREQADHRDGCQPENRAQRPRGKLTRAGDPEDACKQVDVRGALPVSERPEVERKQRAMLVSSRLRDRCRVERDIRLVSVEPRRIRRRDRSEVEDRHSRRDEPSPRNRHLRAESGWLSSAAGSRRSSATKVRGFGRLSARWSGDRRSFRGGGRAEVTPGPANRARSRAFALFVPETAFSKDAPGRIRTSDHRLRRPPLFL